MDRHEGIRAQATKKTNKQRKKKRYFLFFSNRDPFTSTQVRLNEEKNIYTGVRAIGDEGNAANLNETLVGHSFLLDLKFFVEGEKNNLRKIFNLISIQVHVDQDASSGIHFEGKENAIRIDIFGERYDIKININISCVMVHNR